MATTVIEKLITKIMVFMSIPMGLIILHARLIIPHILITAITELQIFLLVIKMYYKNKLLIQSTNFV